MQRILAVVLLLAGLAGAEVVYRTTETPVPVGYIVELPEGFDSTQTYPLVVALHGLGDRMEAYIGTAERLCPEGAIGLYPESPYPFPLGEDEPVRWTWWLWPDSGAWLSRNACVAASVNWILEAIRRTMDEYPVKADQVFLFGFSQGGFLTLAVGLKEPGMFAGLLPAGGWLEPEWTGDPSLDVTLPPMCILHGADDPVCEIGGAERMRDTLEARGAAVELLRYPAGHELTRELFEDAEDFVWRVRHEDERQSLESILYPEEALAPEDRVGQLRLVLCAIEPVREIEDGLIGIYEDEVPAVQRQAIHLLGARRCPGAVGFLRDILWNAAGEPNPVELRQAAYSALVKLATAEAWEVVKATELEVAVRDVVPGSQADGLGVRPGDVVVSYDGRAISRTPDIHDAKAAVEEDREEVVMVIRRDGEELELKLKPGSIGFWTEERPR